MARATQTRRDFIKILGGTTALLTTGLSSNTLFAAENAKPATKKPNIVWLISEDTSPDFACYGNKLVKTPNFDKLAKEGALFTNAFATCPVCSPTRSAFNTGMYQTSIGALQHRTRAKNSLPAPVEVITEYFKRAGYYTSNCLGIKFDKPGKTDWNFTLESKPFDGTDWSGRKKDQPFFAQVNLFMTHRTFKRDKDNPIDPAKVTIPPYYPDHPLTRRDWADYLESLQVLDSQVSQVIKRLEDEDLMDNTIIIYFGDHGRPHVRGKQWLYEGGIAVPMIIRWPQHIKPGTVVDDLISTIDIAPTSLAMAGIDIPKHMQGQPIMGPNSKKRDHIIAARDRCDETSDRIRCVRTKQYKYIRNYYPDRPYTQFNCYKTQAYPVLSLMQAMHEDGKLTPAQALFMAETRPKEELYDLTKDPYEINNLAANSKYADTLNDLSAKLDKWIVETGDQGETPETDEELNYWKESFAKRYAKLMENRGLGSAPTPKERLAWWEKKMLSK